MGITQNAYAERLDFAHPGFIVPIVLMIALASPDAVFGAQIRKGRHISFSALNGSVNEVSGNQNQFGAQCIHTLHNGPAPRLREKRRGMKVGKLDELEAFERRRQILNFGGMTANLGRTDSLRNTRRSQTRCCRGNAKRGTAIFLHDVMHLFSGPSGQYAEQNQHFARGRQAAEEKQYRFSRIPRNKKPARRLRRKQAAEEKDGDGRKRCGYNHQQRQRSFESARQIQRQHKAPQNPKGHDEMKDGESHE